MKTIIKKIQKQTESRNRSVKKEILRRTISKIQV